MRVGIIGLGWAARGFHVPALSTIEGVELVGGADSSADQRSAWTAETGAPAFDSMDELLERSRPDLVVVATPPGSHAELCLAALDAGAHVFCEKPFVSTLAEADGVITAAERAGRRVAVNHEFREKPIFKAVKEHIGTSGVGRLVFCQIWQLMDLAPWNEPVAWRAAMPNRTLFEGGVHLVDLMLSFFGEVPHAVYARHSSGLEAGHDADAVHLVMLEFSQGRLGQITIDRLCKSGTRYVEVRADCEDASVRASHGGRAVLQIGKKRAEKTGLRLDFAPSGLAWVERGLSRRTLARSPRQDGVVATRELLRKVIHAIEEDRIPPSSALEAREALEVIEAAYRSAQTGKRIQVSRPEQARAAAE